MQRRLYSGGSTARLCALVLCAGLAAGGEAGAERFTVVPSPARMEIGTDALVTWTIDGTLPSGALVDVVLTQHDIDHLIPYWWMVADADGTPVHAMGTIRSGHSRSQHIAEDHRLDYPIEVILPGWQLLGGEAPLAPGTYDISWNITEAITSASSTITIAAPTVGGTPTIVPRFEPIRASSSLAATFGPGPHVRSGDQLSVRVTRIPLEFDRPEIWRSAVVEWTRLPDRPGEPTRVYSPILAERVPLLTREAGPAVPRASRDLQFPVADALRDPITGTLVPGRYCLRLAMAWSETVANPSALGKVSVSRRRVHSPGQVVRLLGAEEQPPVVCPVCGAVANPEAHRP